MSRVGTGLDGRDEGKLATTGEGEARRGREAGRHEERRKGRGKKGERERGKDERERLQTGREGMWSCRGSGPLLGPLRGPEAPGTR